MFVAGHMVLRLFLGSHGTLVVVSAPLMMPLRDKDIPMNVPFTFCNKQPLPTNASTVCVGKQCQRVCASLRQTGRLLVADHGNNAVVRIQFAPIYAPELQARSHAN
jgi:hypothetical protein